MGRRGRPPKELPRFPDVTQMSDVKEAREPLDPPTAELFAQAIVRNNGDIRKACSEVLDPLTDPCYTDADQIPDRIKSRVKYLLNRSASDTVATRQEVELLLSQSIRGQSDRVEAIDAIRELCKMKGWYSPVEIHSTHELKVPDRISGMSDADLDRMIALGKEAKTTEPIEIECKEAEDADFVMADTTSKAMLKETEHELPIPE
jgi:hypothetical protein